MHLDLTYRNDPTRRVHIRELRILFATHMFIFTTQDTQEIADALNVNVKRIEKWQTTKTWQSAHNFWYKQDEFGLIPPEPPPPLTSEECEKIAAKRRKKHHSKKNMLFQEQHGFCNGCGKHFHFEQLTLDHIVPKSQGGTLRNENIQLLCYSCNMLKEDGTQAQLLQKLDALGLRSTPHPICSFFARVLHTTLTFILSFLYTHYQ